jgi:hypothetical protein
MGQGIEGKEIAEASSKEEKEKQMNQRHGMKVIKRDGDAKPAKTKDDYIVSHELSLLSLLVKKHPERAREFLARLRDSLKAA